MALQHSLHQSIDTIVSDTLAVIHMMEEVPGMSGDALQTMKKNCRRIPEQIHSNRVKIAVAGVIKSGKSTLINAMTGKEVVKRGAGVVTAITTRIRKGKKNRAEIFLKSWDDINHTLGNILEMFPGDDHKTRGIDTNNFDLRRKKDRAFLTRVYETLVQDFPVTDQGIRQETLMIRNALQGYEFCQGIVGPDQERIVFEAKRFEDHKTFTGDPSKAFYVRDVCLHLFGKTLDPGVEIADCQGADSTDPAQLSRIIHYIQQSNLIIYCISSRTGLRQSDISFLKIIRQLGLFENILFVNNCDLSEHDTLDDLVAIENKTIQDLEFLVPSPEMYSFSALLDLFCAMEKKLSQRNRKRLALWQEDTAMAGYCEKNATKFTHRFSTMLAHHHHRLLVSNHLERLLSMVGAMEKKAAMFMEMLDTDVDDQEKVKKRLSRVRHTAIQLASIVDNAIPGAVSALTLEIDTQLDSAFAKDAIHIRRKISDFIRNTPLDAGPYHRQIHTIGITKVLYLMFQDFTKELDLFVITHVLPDINVLVTQQEKRVADCFQSLFVSFQIDFSASALDMEPDQEMINQQLSAKQKAFTVSVDIQAIKKILGLKVPEMIISPRYSGRIQADALTGLGVTSFMGLFSALFKNKKSFSFAPGFDTAAKKIKKQSLEAINQQIDLVHGRLKTHYFVPLIQAVARDFTDKIHDRFLSYESLDEDMARLFSLRQAQKQNQQANISLIISRLQQIHQDIVQVKCHAREEEEGLQSSATDQ
jgi:GTPase SAR1 family protein